MNMILIAGGSGFIGSHFHELMDDRRIVNLDLKPPEFATEAVYLAGDVRKREDIDIALDKYPCSAIVCLAAEHRDFGITREAYFATNEHGTRNICDMATKYGVEKIVFYSSVAVYGNVVGASSEDMPPLPVSPYGGSKLAGEKVIREWASLDPKRSAVILRPTVVIGERNRANMLRLIRQINSGRYANIGRGDNIKSIAYVKNVVEATLYLYERMNSGVHIFNYADEPQLTVAEIANTIAVELGRRPPISLPYALAYTAALPFDAVSLLTRKDLSVSTNRIRKICGSTIHGASKLFRSGFTPRWSSEEGLRRMLAWYIEQKAAGSMPTVVTSSG